MPEFTVVRSQFSEAASQAARIATTTSSIPILQTMLLDVRADAVWITATDLNSDLTFRVPAEVKTLGRIAVAAQAFASVVNALPGGEINIRSEVDDAVLSCAAAEYRVAGQPEKDFPDFHETTPEAHCFTLNAGLLAALLRQTIFAAGWDKNDPIQCSWAFTTYPGGVRCKSFAPHKFAYRTASLPGVDFDSETLLPLGAAKVLTSLLDSGEVKVLVDRHQITFSAPNFTLASRVVYGSMRDYERHVLGRNDPAASCLIERRGLIDSLRRLKMVGDKDKLYRCTWAFDGPNLTIRQQSPMGQAEERLTVEQSEGSARFDINAAEVLEALQAVDEPVVRLEKPAGKFPLVLWAGERNDWFALLQRLSDAV